MIQRKKSFVLSVLAAVWVVLFPLLFLIFAVDTLILGIIVILLSFFDRKGNVVHYVGKFWSRLNLLLSGVTVRVSGIGQMSRGQPYIVMANHQSLYDVWALIGYLPLQLRWVMKKELRKVPLFGYGCERMGHIYVDRGNPEKARKSLEVVGEKIRAGSSVVFFPEGTRSPDGNLLPFKKGGFVVAIATRVPILPITVDGSRFVLPKGSLRPRPGRISITIHPPVPVDGFTYEMRDALSARIREIIASGLEVGK